MAHGPVLSTYWKLDSEALGSELTIDLWHTASELLLLELSTKFKEEEAEAGIERFTEYVENLEGKTEIQTSSEITSKTSHIFSLEE